MVGLRFVKNFAVAICLTLFLTGAAFANAGVSPDTPVSNSDQNVPQISAELLEKQREIDKYLFETHVKEISDKGIIVTHTGPIGDYVEIGITPYNEANAEFFYETFGREMVKVVEGQQAGTMEIAADSGNAAKVSFANESEDEKAFSKVDSSVLWLVGIGGIALVFGVVMFGRGQKN